MKIVYVITRSDVIGGASVHLLDLAIGMREAGHEVVILVGGKGVFFDRCLKEGLKCISLRHLVRQINPVKDPLAVFELVKVLNRIRPDIVHLHSSKAGIIGRLASWLARVPVVFTAHGWAFTDGVSRVRRVVYRQIERGMARISDHIIVVSEYDRRLAIESGIGGMVPVTTIHNGIGEGCLLPHRLKKSTDDTSVFLIMVARFDRPKNHTLLIESLATIENSCWKLEFVGDGPLLDQTRAQVAELGLTNRVRFSGACDDVEERLKGADIFLLISHWEGFPISILEAMRAGLPVIASDVGGVSEAVVNDKTGYLVGRDSLDALTDVIQRLVDSQEDRQRMGAAARARYKQWFTRECMIQKTLQVYNETLSHRRD